MTDIEETSEAGSIFRYTLSKHTIIQLEDGVTITQMITGLKDGMTVTLAERHACPDCGREAKISDQTRHTHWPPVAQGTHGTLRLTKKGEGMARATKLSRTAK